MDLVPGDTYILKNDFLGFCKGEEFCYMGKIHKQPHQFQLIHSGVNYRGIDTPSPDVYFDKVVVYSAFNPASAIVYKKDPQVGDKLVLTRECHPFVVGTGMQIIHLNPILDEYMLVPVYDPYTRWSPLKLDMRVSRIAVWNWFSMWPGSDDPEVVQPKRCEHKFVNVSFAGLQMECKFCGIPEPREGASE